MILYFYIEHYTIKLYRAHIEYRYVRVKFLFQIFPYFEMYFLVEGIICIPDQICISATHEPSKFEHREPTELRLTSF
jgi:hypothetical protein